MNSTINSKVYGIESEKRRKFWEEYKPKMTEDQKDEVWSIIYARWGKSYEAGKAMGIKRAWQSYFKGMFPIIALELANYKDGISSEKGVIAQWVTALELPDIYGNLELYRQTINK